MTVWNYIHWGSAYIAIPILVVATLGYGTWFLLNMVARSGDLLRGSWVVWGIALWLAFWAVHLILLLHAGASKDVVDHWIMLNFLSVFYLWGSTRSRVTPARIVVPMAVAWSVFGAVLWTLFAAGVLPIGYIFVGYSTLGSIVFLFVLVPAMLIDILGHRMNPESERSNAIH